MSPSLQRKHLIAALKWSQVSRHLAIVTVIRPPEFAGDVETEAIRENARNYFDQKLAEAAHAGAHVRNQPCHAHPRGTSRRTDHCSRRCAAGELDRRRSS